MARYLVGKNGFLKTTWNFIQAVEAAGDGDVIELEEGFNPYDEQNNQPVTITKSITIEGNPDGNGALTNAIDGVVIKNGATVTLKNLEVRKSVSKSNNIRVKEGSTLITEKVVLTSYATAGANHSVLYVDDGSKASFVNSLVAPGNLHDHNYKIYAENATLEIINSTINARVWASNSKLELQDVAIQYAESNALYADKNSEITISSSTLEGGYETEKDSWSCLRLVDSQLTATGMVVNLNDRVNGIRAENTVLKVSRSLIHARVFVSNSKLELQDVTIQYAESSALYANQNSEITVSSSTLEGGCVTEQGSWSCVRLVDSQLNAFDMLVRQPGYHCALYATNAKLSLNVGGYDSLYLERSEASIGHICAVESVFICDGSHVKAEGIAIVGRENGKINLYLNKKSSLEADIVCFGSLTQPNTKAERDTKIHVEMMIQAAYDPEKWEFVLDEEGSIMETGDASQIAYFGEMTAFERLNQMVGIASVKQNVEEFVAIAEMNRKREQQGFKNAAFSLHSMFLGNPGTGKTTVARLLGEILYEKEIISSKKFVETSRSDLVGQYLGETAIKTRGVLESALGGVLFIDEAYTLYAGNVNYKDYGVEAIDEILKFMEDHRQDIVLIFAGYTHSMEQFLESNEGLKSRIPNTFVFEDYTPEELIRIGLDNLHDQKYEIDEKAYADLVCKKHSETDDNSNGRWVRNLNEKLIRKMAVRVSRDPNADLVLITQEDIDAI